MDARCCKRYATSEKRFSHIGGPTYPAARKTFLETVFSYLIQMLAFVSPILDKVESKKQFHSLINSPILSARNDIHLRVAPLRTFFSLPALNNTSACNELHPGVTACTLCKQLATVWRLLSLRVT
jgi:hypothetical protein